MARRKPAANNTATLDNLFSSSGAPTGPIYHPSDYSFEPGARSGVSMDEPLYHTGKTLRDVMNEHGGGDFHDSMPTYGGQSTRMDPRSAPTRMDTPVVPSVRNVLNPRNSGKSSSRASNGGSIAQGLAMGMGVGHTSSRKGNLIKAIELAGLHDHAGNNRDVITQLVNQ